MGKLIFFLPDSAFSDLREPNFYKTFGPLRPLEVYSTVDKDYFFIYIFGDTGLTLTDPAHRLSTTFIGKLIFDRNGYVGRILIGPDDLVLFHIDCKDFIGF